MKSLRPALLASFALFITLSLHAQEDAWTMRVINPGYQLNSAWELTYGPDDSLWVTENFAYLVSRIDPQTGGKTLLLDLSAKKDFTNPTKWPQGGLMGMALHPSMYSEWPNPAKPYVYLAYVYKFLGCDAGGSGPCRFKTKIVRYTYNRTNHSLTNERVIIESLNGSNDHNSGRLTIGNIGGTDYLFYTIGDMGAGQFNNINRPNNAQTRDTLEGKVLRFNLEQDSDINANDKWIPNDNPFQDANGKKTAVWSWGHRNAQGIVFGSNGMLYSSEQQDRTDDEVNIIENSRNYGWPKVSGYCDGNYNGLKLANQIVISEQDNCTNLNVREPVYTLFTHPHPETLGSSYLTWPTVACSSIDIYEKNVIPGWKNSLLVPSLKAGQIFRLKLSEDGSTVTDSSTVPIMRNKGRYRDLAISPDGLKIYVACDISGQTSGPTGGYNGGGSPPPNPGRILEFSYSGIVMSINDSVNSYIRNAEIEIFPNPTSKKLQVRSVKNITKPLYYYLFDASGKMLREGKSNSDFFDVNVADLSKGVYILKIHNAYGIHAYTGKVIIQ